MDLKKAWKHAVFNYIQLSLQNLRLFMVNFEDIQELLEYQSLHIPQALGL